MLYAHAAYGFSSADENHVLESVDFGTLDKEDAEIDADADAEELEAGTSTTLLIHENTRAGTIQIAHHRHGHVHRKFIVGNGGYRIILIHIFQRCSCADATVAIIILILEFLTFSSYMSMCAAVDIVHGIRQ